jgi:hypothetical protein
VIILIFNSVPNSSNQIEEIEERIDANKVRRALGQALGLMEFLAKNVFGSFEDRAIAINVRTQGKYHASASSFHFFHPFTLEIFSFR